jgi:geranylgeranyl diphosphate synthase type II
LNSSLQHDLTSQINRALEQLSLPEEPASLYEPIRYTLDLGGKRIRPYLTLLAAGMCGGSTEKAMEAALSIEILHNFTLIHDDIMDQADIRRGEPSVHVRWDEATAILSGDAMFGRAYELLNAYGEDDSISKSTYHKLLKSFQYAVRTVCEGQALDMDFVSSESVSIDDYIKMIEGKTSALLSSALEMGALTAGADEEKVNRLFHAGRDMGIAFQIQDDLLDATADPEKFGKKAGGDIYEGKKTYLSILALQRAKPQDSVRIQSILHKPVVSESEVEWIIQLYHDLGILSETQKLIDSYYLSAFGHLNTFESSAYKTEIEKLLTFLKERDH